ncbi:MAG: Bax inhibitor-1/YccA family protein [Gammaproteobacteria bacterium]|nr:Bax inhibitor-1/YccA family protein [Gammaproteobacteria bacterium]
MKSSSIATRSEARLLAEHKVLRNTYALLAMTLLFSAFTAWLAMQINMPRLNVFVVLAGYFGLLWLTHKFCNQALGILFVFLLTGFMGLTLGPVLDIYLNRFANGNELVTMALGGTGVIFLSMSAIALTTRKDFSFMGNFLMIGILIGFIAAIANIFFQMPALSLAISSVFIFLMAGLILYETSAIVHGGETNYILATVTLFVSIYNLFTSLLHILGVFSGED